MVQPIILIVEGHLEVLRVLEDDLRGRYGDSFQLLATQSPERALASLRDLNEHEDPVAVMLVERHMDQLSGVDFLRQTVSLVPRAKRVLITASLDDDGRVRVRDVARVDYSLLGPAAPPPEYLYPLVDELLADWQGPQRTLFTGTRVVGHRWSPKTHEIRDFLTRSEVHYEWLDMDTDPDAEKVVAEIDGGHPRLPLVQFPDGACLQDPSLTDLAEKLGLQTEASHPSYDLIIVGAGPAGLAAGVYAASEGLDVLMIDREAPGGQAGMSSHIDNYLGFPEGIRGADLATRAVAQAERFGAEIVVPQSVTGIHLQGNRPIVALSDGSERHCRALLIAIGVAWRKLDVPGIDELTGAGVYYGGTLAEARSCREEDIYIVGGSNSAGQAAVHFSRYARSVVMLVRGDSLEAGMSQYLVGQIEQTPNITVLLHTEVAAVQGEGRLESIIIRNSETGRDETLHTHALFIFIGAAPETAWLDGLVELDKEGYILTGPELVRAGKRPPGWPLSRDPYLLETSVPGIFAAGDVRHGAVKRVAAAVGAGSMAVQFIHRYLDTV